MPIYEKQISDTSAECPYCEFCNHVEEADYSDREYEFECHACCKKFYLSQEVTITHTAIPDCVINGYPHDFEIYELSGHQRCKVCGVWRAKQ